IDGNPEGSSPLVLVRREAPSTLFAAVHEPYRGRPAIREVRRLVESPGAAALAITAPAFTDYALAAFDDKEHALATAEGEAFTFSEYAYVRFAAGGATVRGKVRGIRIREQLL